MQIFVEAAINIAVQGTVRPSKNYWEQLKNTKHRRFIRALVDTRSLPKWRQLLSRNIESVRLLANCLIEQVDGAVKQ